jgi:hypothetical protein
MTAQTQTGSGKAPLPLLQNNTSVLVNIFDGHVSGERGKVIGHGINSDGENVYLVEMNDQQPPMSDKLIGTEQIRQGKKWVLSLYPEEVTPA